MPGRIVAELGRPETPQETADRKAASREAHQRNQTTFNLVTAIVASLLVVGAVVLFTAAPNAATAPRKVAYASIAADASASIPLKDGVRTTLAAPAIPASWYANRAVWSATTADKVPRWAIGFITAKQQYIGLDQGVGGDDSWVENVLQSKLATGTESVGGVSWTVYDHRKAANAGNLAYALSATFGQSEVVLSGTADDAEFRQLATAVTAQLSAGN